MKIAVYTIAKNEEQYAARWADSTKGADYRVVLDTGSTDRTKEILRDAGVLVHETSITPWRFDEARNQALALVPPDVDVCVSLDMDEVLREGWREVLELVWTPGTTVLRHPLYPEWEPDHSAPKRYFGYVARVHARNLYRWHYAVHEMLVALPTTHQRENSTDAFVIDHLTDHTKPKMLYTTMLEQWVQREPGEPRYWFYWGVDLYNRGKYAEAIEAWYRYLAVDPLRQGNQRAFAKRMIASTLRLLGRPVVETLPLLHAATADAPEEREAWLALAESCAEVGNWPNALSAAVNAMRCTDPSKSFHISFDAWQGRPMRLVEQSAQALHIPHETIELLKEQVGS